MKKLIYILLILTTIGCSLSMIYVKNSEEIEIESKVKSETILDSISLNGYEKNKVKE